MRQIKKYSDVQAGALPHGTHSVEDVFAQLAEIGGLLQVLIRQVETLQDQPSSLRNLRSPMAVHDAVHHVYRRQELTPREIEVCALMIRGYADGEIARTLGVRPGTIKTHAARVCEKLNLDRKRIPWDFFHRLAVREEDVAAQPTVEESASLWR